MESILVLTHADETGAALSKASLEAVTAGMDLAARMGELTIGIVATDASSAAGAVAGSGARLLAVSGEAFAQARYASDAAACEACLPRGKRNHYHGAAKLAFRAGHGRGCASRGRTD